MAARQEGIVATESATVDVVRAVKTREDRVVLTVDGIPDAWIASDLAVDVPR